MADLLPTDEPTLPLLLDVSILDDNGSLGSSESPSHLDLVNVNFAHRGLKELPDHLISRPKYYVSGVIKYVLLSHYPLFLPCKNLTYMITY